MRKAHIAKQEVVDLVKDRFTRSNLAILADYRGPEKGLSVSDVTTLRRNIRAKAGEYHVVKNTLTLRAMQEMQIDGMQDHLKNPTALIFAFNDPVEVAKAIADFAKTRKTNANPNGLPMVKVGYMEGKILNTAQIMHLATLPSKEMLIRQLLYTMNAPIQGLHRVLSEPMGKLVRVLSAIQKNKE